MSDPTHEIDWNRIVERIVSAAVIIAGLIWGQAERGARKETEVKAEQREGALDVCRERAYYPGEPAAYYEGAYGEVERQRVEHEREAK